MINIVELFSGIGSQAKAFNRLGNKMGIKVNVLKTCEWDVHAIVAYDYIHNDESLIHEVRNMSRENILKYLSQLSLSNDGKNPINCKTLNSYPTQVLKKIYSAIIRTNNMISVKDVKGSDIPDNLTLLTYSFPCQDLSNGGCLHGYNKGIDRDAHNRSGLLWEVERILKERKALKKDMPKFLLLENVTSLEAERHKNNFEEWKQCLENLGYVNQINRLYAPDFGIPQNRKRLLMLSVYVGKDKLKKEKAIRYFQNNNLNKKEYIQQLNIRHQSVEALLKTDYSVLKYRLEADESQPNNTPSRINMWNNNLKIVDEKGNISKIVQTITTKQDRHPNSGNIYYCNNNGKSNYRFLTPRECFLMMGFDEKDYDVLVNNNFASRKNALFFSRDKLYKLAGNSIVVNMLEAIFRQVVELDKELYE